MDTLIKLFREIRETPLTTLLIVAGLAFLFIAVLGSIGSWVKAGKVARILSGLIGISLLVIGGFILPRSPESGRLNNKHSEISAHVTPQSEPADRGAGNQPEESMQILVTATSPESQQILVTVTSPSAGEEVGREMVVKGTASIPDDNHLWVLARRHDFAPLWWPQREAKIDIETHEWAATAVFGGPQDIGWDFEIGVIAVNGDGHRELMNYWIAAAESGDWRPRQIPATTSQPRIVRVKKTRH